MNVAELIEFLNEVENPDDTLVLIPTHTGYYIPAHNVQNEQMKKDGRNYRYEIPEANYPSSKTIKTLIITDIDD